MNILIAQFWLFLFQIHNSIQVVEEDDSEEMPF